ncbi:bifunctional (p)ppGpp synthetase/guanosine-3',5'-bis(diphosphate) 3'-pyrophosphohydrolase [Leptolyngbyaceae cyanobacterium CCMR0082]|uniref:Bifunctional (P)ppGpp synthetase/guanosine-3',5'-bis(Diphosphate) 3'-pyrophosphohydrolase n=2 Tax=Adonisia turfae TaxID=2950184 RepID=A0A6M0S4I1_9CYAN|nr:bifunctional (p)ppGpp synthetase/guanosine-3',5'-bis(diphosphate) 3'-pyrophosphohydrolase [Adonisia turfae]MDV3350506.1 bifunctional (p)ppGpp synthetase/guanosine-3',5'-bis(diphosphate) 3'-pyrophosphohydrolase [Leptothoe sp. LEGE 181152]NEZ55661.1 bifunctional (p)ppGpp synthetase/guanosine-3',5'-bis(diphosphate) 3'-pyrophosphohydrolase [Adonisia turfae CCMR0081]NEZ63358.1 bifunctional (p)ppGpp synthetase/guanosine-3',5'-bis(diphosphate) 3'-pyrophosphohydrolase [Adonisia turfae CCMR0082]
MTPVAPVIPKDCTLPTWLRSCILEHSQPIEIHGDSQVPLERPKDNNQLVCRAFEFAYQLHKGQMRASGEPYIAHPVAVANILRSLGGDSAMIAAGFLHDVVEDTDVSADEIEAHFGAEVRQMVEGVTKLSKFQFNSKTERQAENFRRMFLAMAQDIRVIVVKLADRLHNMRTLQHLPPEKQVQKACETIEIFAPLANRLGIGRMKWELEDLSFKYLEESSYQEIKNLISEKRVDREARLKQVAELLETHLTNDGINCVEISSRPKHLYSIYRKMQRQKKDFHQIYDIAAVRIIVSTKVECYRALAVVHDQFKPIPGRFKDYIGLPKANRYQSLHTAVIGEQGRPIEVQIRTMEMHHVAEYGIAAHWKYKETGNSNTKVNAEDEKFTWLRQLLEWQSDLKDAQEYLSDVKDNLFDEEVYVFSPRGDVFALSQGATPVDFAYRIHTEVGHHCAGAKVNDRIVTLDTQLENGDIVEVLTNKHSHPSLDWLNFVVSAGARNRIRHWYKQSHHDENMARGHAMLEKVMGRDGLDSLLKSAPAQAAARRSNYPCVEDMLAALGYGEITLNAVVNRLQEATKELQPIDEGNDEALAEQINEGAVVRTRWGGDTHSSASGSSIIGVEGLLHHIAGCCNPLPGEPILGAVSMGARGIAIHRQGCPNVASVPGDRLIPVRWNSVGAATGRPQTYPVMLKLEVIDRVGVLKDILSHLSDLKINVHRATVTTFPDQIAEIDLGLDVKDHAHFDRTIKKLRKMTDVLKLKRLSQMD